MKKFLICVLMFVSMCLSGAVQYNYQGNQGWLTFDSETELTLDISRSGKKNEHGNFIDKGEGVLDYGWYNLNTNESGSLKNQTFLFNEEDKIAIWLTDNQGKTYITTKIKDDNYIWGKSSLIDNNIALYGGNKGSNGTLEYYVLQVNHTNKSNEINGQPLPTGIGMLFSFAFIFALWYVYFNSKKKIGV